jgi:hypothetical protein
MKAVIILTALASAVLFLIDAPAVAYAIAPVICMAVWIAEKVTS